MTAPQSRIISPAIRAAAIASLKAAMDQWQPGCVNGVTITADADGATVRWITWAPNGEPFTGKIELSE